MNNVVSCIAYVSQCIRILLYFDVIGMVDVVDRANGYNM